MKRSLLLTFAALFITLFLPRWRSYTDGPSKDSEFVYGRLRYHMTVWGQRMREVAWHHDYPYSDETFPTVVAEVTNIKTSPNSYQIVDIDSPDLFKFPFYYFCEPGFIDILPKDAANLRNYLDRGGFLFVDDFRTAPYDNRYIPGGEDDINHFRMEMKKVYPDREFVRLRLDDPIFNTFYKIESLEVKAPYVFRGQGPAEFWALRDPEGHIQMILNDNNDVSEAWEWLDEGRYSMHDAATSFQFGIDYLIYAMTH